MLSEASGGVGWEDAKVDLAMRGPHTNILSKYLQNLIGFWRISMTYYYLKYVGLHRQLAK